MVRPRGESVSISRSEIRSLADALAPLIARFPSRARAAESMGLSDGSIAKIVRRPASLSISRVVLDDLGRATGIDTSRFGA